MLYPFLVTDKPPKRPDGSYSQVSRHVIRRRGKVARATAAEHDEFVHEAPTQVVDAPIGDGWLWAFWKETLGRNLATAGAIELYYRLGRTHSEIERLQSRTKTIQGCEHTSTMTYTQVRVCTVCLKAIDRVPEPA